MIRKLALGLLLTVGACASLPVAQAPPPPGIKAETEIAMAALCSADASGGKTFKANLALTEGMGTGGFKVDSSKPEAQRWFDYGLALSHAFYHDDAKVAMKKAREADPECSICAFGEAFVLGPNLNQAIDDKEREAALAAAEQALRLAKDDRSRRLAQAAVARYQKAEKSTEPAFGQALAAIADAYPQDADIEVLAIHSLLIPFRGGDARGLKPALERMERVLAKRPNDTGAIHYYIHATEFDGRAEDALPYAARLGDLAPLASHLVHMPAHTFYRAGLYQDAAVVNASAIGADSRWWNQGGDAAGASPMYYQHNLSFGVAGALMSGDAPLALKYADHAPRIFPSKDGKAANNTVARTWVALALYAPQEALKIPEQDKGTPAATWRAYARGEALIRLNQIDGAQVELAALAGGTNEVQKIAHGVLAGRIAMAQGEPKKAARLYEAAAQIQRQELLGWDPPSWWFPVYRSVAAAHLAAGNARKAEAVAADSLTVWKHDPMALWVMGKAQEAQGKAVGAETLSQARSLWHGDLSKVTATTI